MMWLEKRKPYENCKIYGVYWGKDGRSRIIVIFPDGRRKTVSYPKFLMEVKLGRFLKKDETVDHIDRDPRNNNYSNLRVLKRKEHARIDAKYLKPQKFICPMCGKEFELSGTKLHDAIDNRRKGKAGPFCSKSCAGRYGRLIQLGRIKPLPVKLIKREYYRLKDKE